MGDKARCDEERKEKRDADPTAPQKKVGTPRIHTSYTPQKNTIIFHITYLQHLLLLLLLLLLKKSNPWRPVRRTRPHLLADCAGAGHSVQKRGKTSK
jgi:hypothetical protein